jgi:uncharacterized protein (TIGR00369 family)
VTDVERDQLKARLLAGETIAPSLLPDVEKDGFAVDAIGLRFGDLSLERVTASVDIGPQHHQPYGIVHGGVWCAIIETLASIGGALHGVAMDRLVVGVSNATDFLRPHREGTVDAAGTPIHVGRTQQLWQVEVTRRADGKPVARGQVRLQNVQPEQIGG